MPVFLQKTNRIKALIRLLLVALKFVSLIEYQANTKLDETQQEIQGLYAGNPKRATNSPTTKQMLRAFNNIHLNIISVDDKIHVSVSKLNVVQRKILDLIQIPVEIYTNLSQISFSGLNFSET